MTNTIPHAEQSYGFDEEYALARLLVDGVLFCNTRDFLWDDKKAGRTVVLFVNCNDTFAPASDSEEITADEIKSLYHSHTEDPNYGAIKWVARRRNLQPWSRARERMKASGAWEEWMNQLGENKI